MSNAFALPDIGSGLQEAEIIEWHVAVGDTVSADQVLCEVETEKSVVEIPVPFGGVVLSLAGPVGSTVNVGEMLVVIGEAGEVVATDGAEDVAEATGATSEVAIAAAPPPGEAASAPTSMATRMERPIAMPLVRRIPKRGFNNRFALTVAEINVAALEAAFETGQEVNPDILREKSLVKGRYDVLKVLGNGELTKGLKVSAHRFSASAKEKIEKAGGTADVLAGPIPLSEKTGRGKKKSKPAGKAPAAKAAPEAPAASDDAPEATGGDES